MKGYHWEKDFVFDFLKLRKYMSLSDRAFEGGVGDFQQSKFLYRANRVAKATVLASLDVERKFTISGAPEIGRVGFQVDSQHP